jgi:EpsI family protein
MANGPFAFLTRRPAQILTILLLIQAVLYYTKINNSEYKPLVKPLSEFPLLTGKWQLAQEGVVDEETRDVLKADDLMTRTYSSPEHPLGANLFIAYFQSQRTGKGPHSPKNCLPGSGWTQEQSGTTEITLPGGRRIVINRYLVSRGDNKSLVLYWYQSRDRVVASEYMAKIHLVVDSIRLNRSDTSLVRVVVPVVQNDIASADRAAENFVQSFFKDLEGYFPA